MKVGVVSLGCSKNLVDSDFIMRYLPYMDAKLPVLLWL